MSDTATREDQTEGVDRTSPGIGELARDYLVRIKGGDVGALPAVLGLVVLVAVFSALRPQQFTGAAYFQVMGCQCKTSPQFFQ